MMQWIYTEYFNIYTQYITYFTTLLMLLASAAALSYMKAYESDKDSCARKFFFISCLLAFIDIYIVFMIFDALRTELLLMSGKCKTFGGELACDANVQVSSSLLRWAILILIISFLSLVIGYFFKSQIKR